MFLLVNTAAPRQRLDDEARRDPDAIEAVYRKLNAADEAEAARRALGGPSTVP
jgi:hypothetical protein